MIYLIIQPYQKKATAEAETFEAVGVTVMNTNIGVLESSEKAHWKC